MIDYIKYRHKLAVLLRQKDRLRAESAADIRKAQKEGKPWEDIESLKHDSWFEEQMVDEELSIATTDHLITRARRRFVPIPSHEETGMWRQCKAISDTYVLTHAGISKLRSSLRLEAKERNELLLPILAALTGIVGVTTGLVAVLLR